MIELVNKNKDDFGCIYPVLEDEKIIYRHEKYKNGIVTIDKSIGQTFRLTSINDLCIVSDGVYEYLYNIKDAERISAKVDKIDDFIVYKDHRGEDVVARVREYLIPNRSEVGEITYYINPKGEIITDIYSNYLNKFYNLYLGYYKVLSKISDDLKKEQAKQQKSEKLLLKIRYKDK